nr:hypothetical protein Iba_chr01dCG12400 [Ipomoea batatas]
MICRRIPTPAACCSFPGLPRASAGEIWRSSGSSIAKFRPGPTEKETISGDGPISQKMKKKQTNYNALMAMMTIVTGLFYSEVQALEMKFRTPTILRFR